MNPRVVARLILALAGTAGAAMPAVAVAPQVGSTQVHLPVTADAVVLYAEPILFGSKGIETRLPGAVDDQEAVSVDLALDGAPDAVTVVQRLTIHGLGDFEFKIPGPASTVDALPGSQNQPGLRKGSVLWQGFSPGEKHLGATMHLFPDQEAKRLPIRMDLSMSVGGRPLRQGKPDSGPLVITLRIRNVSALPIQASRADGDAGQMAALLDAMRSDLRHGKRPVPGQDGLPTSVPAAGPVTRVPVAIEAPFRVSGELAFPAGTLSGATSEGGTLADGPEGTRVAFGGLLSDATGQALTVRVEGQAVRLGLAGLRVDAEPALPFAAVLRPPGPGTWRDNLARGDVDGEHMLALAVDTLWRVARLRQFDAYLGNPDVGGLASASYTFRLAPARPAPATSPVASAPVRPLPLAALTLAGLLLLFGLAVVWSRS